MCTNKDSPESCSTLDDNDFDIIERYYDSEDGNPPSADIGQHAVNYPSSGFPIALHRSLLRLNLGTRKVFEEATPNQIECAQKYIYDNPESGMRDFTIKQELEKVKNENLSFNANSAADHTTKDEVGSNEIKFTFKINKNELLKNEWTNPVDSWTYEPKTASELKLHELRFDFGGFLMSSDTYGKPGGDNPDLALYNHGLEPQKPGYTIPELVQLLQSSFKPQVQVAMKTIVNILFRSYNADNYYFGYDCKRWYSYIHNDVNLIEKVGYVICESHYPVNVLIDALNCLSLLLFGDYVHCSDMPQDSEKLEIFLMPLQEILFDTYQFDIGLNIYHWNTSSVKFSYLLFKKDALGSACPQKVKERHVGLDEFYKKAIDDEFVDIPVDEIKENILAILGADLDSGDEKEDFMDSNMDSTLFLLTRYNLASKLMKIIKQYKNNAKVQVYSLSVICGLLEVFGTPMANALIKVPDFVQHLEQLIGILIVGSKEYISYFMCMKDYAVPLTTMVLLLVKYVSIYADDGFSNFCDGCGAIALVKQTLTEVFRNQISQLMEPSSEANHKISFPCQTMLTPACIALRCLSIWSIKGEYNDTLDELLPIVDFVTLTIVKLVKSNKALLDELMTRSGHILAIINLHMATIIEHGGMHNHFKFTGNLEKVNVLTSILCGTIKENWGSSFSFLLYSLFQLQSIFMQSYAKQEGKTIYGYSVTEFVENQRQTFIAMASSSETIKDYFMESVENGLDSAIYGPKWWNLKTFTGSYAAIYDQDFVKNSIFCNVLPVKILNCMLDIVITLEGLGQNASDLLNLDNGSPLLEMRGRMIDILRDLHLKKLRDDRLLYNLEGRIGVTSSIPTLEGWSFYLANFDYFCKTLSSEERLRGILAALSNTSNYDTIKKLLERLVDLNPAFKKEDSEELFATFVRFNQFVASSKTLGDSRMSLLTFTAYISIFPVVLIMNGNDTSVSKTSKIISNLIGHNIDFMDRLLMDWTCPPSLFANLANAISCTNKSADYLAMNKHSTDILQFFVFKRLRLIKEPKGGPTVDKSMGTLQRWSRILFKLKQTEFSPDNNSFKHFQNIVSVEGIESMCKVTLKIIKKFNSGMGDSSIIIAVLMVLLSGMSHRDCAKLIWADENLVSLIGKNVTVDFDSTELSVSTNPDQPINIGAANAFIAPFNDDENIKGHQIRLMSDFTDNNAEDGNAILLIALASLAKYCTKDTLIDIRQRCRSYLISGMLKYLIDL